MTSLGNNIKVHFAGSEEHGHSVIDSLCLAGVKYRLFSVFSYINGKRPGDDFRDTTGAAKRTDREFNHVILDSGLFTLMFGAGKGKRQTVETLTEWQDKTFQFIQQNGLNCTLVEIDCQKVLGVEYAWHFRRRAREMLGNKQINVFHWEDGKDGLDRLIDFSEYIAISVPEIRILHPKTFRQDVHRLAKYIKIKKPKIDIHLLGCTDKKMLFDNRFCTSADSSSWTGVYRYATIDGRSAYNIKPEVYNQYEARYMKFLGDKWFSLSPKAKRRLTWELFSAEYNKRIYEKYAGDQN